MKILSSVLFVVGLLMMFLFGSLLDSGGSLSVLSIIGVLVGIALMLIGYLIGKDVWEHEEII